ncbi:MAG: hypothetical protein AAB692_03135, partial [Patescibacteria group bacterium]
TAISGDLDLAGHALLNVRSITSANGSWSIDESGNLTIKEIEAEKITIKNTDASSTIGTGKVTAGSDTVVVANNQVKAGSKIFFTWSGNPGAYAWVENIADGSFTLRLASPAPQDVEFSYWIVGVTDLRTPAVTAPPVDPPSIEPPPTVVADEPPAPAPIEPPTVIPDEAPPAPASEEPPAPIEPLLDIPNP